MAPVVAALPEGAGGEPEQGVGGEDEPVGDADFAAAADPGGFVSEVREGVGEERGWLLGGDAFPEGGGGEVDVWREPPGPCDAIGAGVGAEDDDEGGCAFLQPEELRAGAEPDPREEDEEGKAEPEEARAMEWMRARGHGVVCSDRRDG